MTTALQDAIRKGKSLEEENKRLQTEVVGLRRGSREEQQRLKRLMECEEIVSLLRFDMVTDRYMVDTTALEYRNLKVKP